LPSNLFQPRNAFFNRNQATVEIQQLLLRRNRLESLKIYSKAISHFKKSLTELSLRENNFTKFPQEILILTNLTSLSLASNQIQFIEEGLFSKLTNLQWINLSGNHLSCLPSDIVCCHFLRGIDLENNAFESKPFFFKKKKKKKSTNEFQLSLNVVEFPHILFFQTRLEVLLIQRNNLSAISDEYYFPNTLTTLNLAFNALTEIPFSLIHHPPEAITHLHLSGNKIRELPLEFLSVGYSKLVSLDLHTCHLKSCPPVFFKYLSKFKDLKRLNLAINYISSIPPEIGLLKQLQWLNMNDNTLESLPAALGELNQLVKLGLVQNKLQELPPFLFINMLKLQKLDIRRNLLRYMPPSVLALAPRHEVDTHVDLAAPHSIFYTLSQPPQCQSHLSSKAECKCYPYGGSLRTLLFYENPTIEQIDGILCNLGTSECETVKLMSMADAFSALRSNANQDPKKVLCSVLFPNNNDKQLEASYTSGRASDMLSDIDTIEDEGGESDSLVDIARTMFTQITSLKELSLRQHLTYTHHSVIKRKFGRLDQNYKCISEFIDSVLPKSVVPKMLHFSTQRCAWQCDYCQGWYTESRFQIGYLTRLCNNRLQIPIRFNICSANCVLESVIQLHQTSTNWTMRQSLTHIESLISLPPPLLPLESQLDQGDFVDDENGKEDRDMKKLFIYINLIFYLVSQSKYSSSLTRLIKERVTKFATSLFNSVSSEEEEDSDDEGEVLPEVSTEATSIPSVTLRMIENRLHTDRSQPHVRLSEPTPNPTAFNHLPGDAIMLERF
jgi:Leucine-rich repeat (LRR) protein